MWFLLPVLYILTAVALVALLLHFIWVRLHVVYDDEDGLRIWLQILFYKYQFVPEKPEKIKLRNFKIKRFRKLERKRQQKAEKQRRKKHKRGKEKLLTEEISTKLPLTEKIALTVSIVKRLIKRFAKYLYIDVSKLYIKVATDDAAKTAYLYSAACQSVAYLTELLDNLTNFDVRKNAEFAVYPDFTTEQSEFAVNFTFRVRAIDLPKLGDFGTSLLTTGN